MDGDHAEFADFVVGWQAALLRAAFLVTGDRHLAKDLLRSSLEQRALRWRATSTPNGVTHPCGLCDPLRIEQVLRALPILHPLRSTLTRMRCPPEERAADIACRMP